MIVKTTIEERGPLTKKEIEMLKRAGTLPVVFDEDSPKLSPEELKEFRQIKDQNKKYRNKQSITLRLSPQTIDAARALGKGYTSVLGRILESALANPEVLKNFL